MKKSIYFKNLDGLRFFCFLSVFLFHSFYSEIEVIKNSPIYVFFKKELFANGNLGVNFFFVLSGFLITYLLVEEKKMNGQISLPKFWLRRILRIWPLFFICVFIGFVIFPFIKNMLGLGTNETADPVYYLTFLNNFDFINKGLPDASILGVLWSIAIEEQFYFIWPIIIFLFPLKKLWIPFTVILLSNLIFRSCNDTYMMHEYHTLSCIGDMSIGAIGAWLFNISNRFRIVIEKFSRFHILLIYLLLIFVFLFRDEFLFSNSYIRIFERLIISIIILFVILEQSFSINSLFKLSNFKKISNLGIITYGLYCLHFIGILITINITKYFNFNNQLWQVMILETILSLLITVIIAKLSYKYFELPFLKFKERFSFITKNQV
ncbi:MAG: acyltransferase [Bacteroidetes bacterium RIFOXYB2_FULL_35_7]|nr:MAG: acyltransferase [Bacteroidetes bacterium GWF2_35_48]OFY95495.1 MAG: acyltransferase [Bacteroidetes bacterium RIFOXYB2_FULL_35_7]OFZ00137.1 MAG: acyltransferase [Bacteroidetes bacterium RIFOXYC12_FULL_35_7]HBX53004.1 acyltransferase [Bacteroidales bacterium]